MEPQKEVNCREVCQIISEQLIKAHSIMGAIGGGGEGAECKEEVKRDGSLANLEDHLASIRSSARRLIEKLESMNERI